MLKGKLRPRSIKILPMEPNRNKFIPVTFDIRRPTLEELPKIQAFRRHLLKSVTANSKSKLSDIDLDSRTIHIAAFLGGEVVGCVRFEVDNFRVGNYFVSRMATRADVQGSGIGAGVMKYGERLAQEQGGVSITLDARSTAVGFYQKMGYSFDGGRLAAKAADQAMTKQFQLGH